MSKSPWKDHKIGRYKENTEKNIQNPTKPRKESGVVTIPYFLYFAKSEGAPSHVMTFGTPSKKQTLCKQVHAFNDKHLIIYIQ